MGVSYKGISQQLCFISWQLLLLLIIVFLLNLQSANCVSSIENIPSGYGVNNWTTGATTNEAEYATDKSDEELFLMESPHHHQYYNDILVTPPDPVSYKAFQRKPIFNTPRYGEGIAKNLGGGQNPCGFQKRLCR